MSKTEKINSDENINTELCPCGSGKKYDECCGAIISGAKSAASPEDLMRARYTAFTKGEVDFIYNTIAAEKREENDRAGIEQWSKNSKWLGLEIHNTKIDSENPDIGFVEFTATYIERGIKLPHHELAEFHKINGVWFFYDGQLISQPPLVRAEAKIGRNDPCPCGSGKKYKKCCGK
mgnify:CR=1 FL=1